MRKHFFNENYFESIDNEEKAYWLGFISADGSVTKTTQRNSYRLQINLKNTDREHLELFKEHIGAKTVNIYEFQNDSGAFGKCEISRLVLNSHKLCKDLFKQNVTMGKTNDIEMPVIREDLIRHYIRGFIDGDGSFSFCRRKGTDKFRFSFEIVGNSRVILEQFQYFFERHGVNLNIYSRGRENKNCYRLMTSSHKNMVKLIDIIYENSSVYLNRKFIKSQQIKNIYSLSI